MNVRTLSVDRVNLLFAYENVLRCPDTFLIQKILKDYKDKFRPYIDIETMETLTPQAILPYIIGRNKRNILEYLAIKEFDYEKNYKYLHKKFLNMYDQSYRLLPFTSIYRLLRSYCVNKIYVYNEEYDKRQHFDIVDSFGEDDRVVYCTGSMQAVIDKIQNLKIVYDWKSERVKELTDNNKNSEIIFVLAAYGFNYDGAHLVDNLEDRMNVSSFDVFIPTEENRYKG